MTQILPREKMTEKQEQGVAHLKTHPHSLLWWPMGKGKTVTTLTAIRDMIMSAHIYGAVIVAPLRVVLMVWRQEASKWEHLRHLKISVVRGTPAQRSRAIMVKADIYITNYDNMSWLADALVSNYLNKGRYLPFNMVVYDEISKMRNFASKRVSAMIPVTAYIERRTGLTGTPAPNGLDGLFSQMLLIDSGARLGQRKTSFHETYFSKRMGTPFEKYDPTPQGKDLIFEKLSDITSVLEADHFPVSVNDIVVRIDPTKMRMYREMEQAMLLELRSGHVLDIVSKGVLFGKTQQYANGAMYLVPGAPEWEEVHKEKLDALEELIDGTGDDPILLAYTFQSDIDRIMAKFGNTVVCLHGGLSDEETIAITARWDSGQIKVMAGHPASIGHGLNLQHGGHHLCWFGATPDLELYLQFNARLPRRGQENEVIIHRILAEDTVDFLIVEMLDSKAETEDELKRCVAEYSTPVALL